jgi:hypothetical protein
MRRVDGLRTVPASAPPGFTVAEVLVAATLIAVLSMLLFGALTVHVRLARQLAQRVLDADAVRTASTVLGGELRRGMPADVRAVSRDSLGVRGFRGIATICAASAGNLVVQFRGDRLPQPVEDSLLWLAADGPETAVALLSVQPDATGGCTGVTGGVVQQWRTEPPLPERGVLLLFESGTYFLSAGALRYRLGAAGRQPLTAELFVHPATGFVPREAGTIEYHLAVAAMAGFPVIAAVHYPPRSTPVP